MDKLNLAYRRMRSEDNNDYTDSMNLGIVKVNISGSVSSHSSNTRSSDNSAKYHVDVRATNHGTPEGLARVLDMMASAVSPTLVNSTAMDADGKALPEERKARTEKIKQLRQEIMQLETQQSATEKALLEQINQFKRIGSLQQNQYQSLLQQAVNKEEDEKEQEKIQQVLDAVNASWNNFQMQVPSAVQVLAADQKDGTQGNSEALSDLFTLLAPGEDHKSTIAYASGQSYYQQLCSQQDMAVTAQKNVNAVSEKYSQKKVDYNNLISGIDTEKTENAVQIAIPEQPVKERQPVEEQ